LSTTTEIPFVINNQTLVESDEQTTIKAGDTIVCEFKNGMPLLLIFRGHKTIGWQRKGWCADNKRLTKFITGEDVFIDFVLFLASTHGFSARFVDTGKGKFKAIFEKN